MLDYVGSFPDYPAIPSYSPAHVCAFNGTTVWQGLVTWPGSTVGYLKKSSFVVSFGRSFRPHGSDEELEKYGNLIADRLMSYGHH